MEKYDAICRAINDKIESCEIQVEWYREQLMKAEKRISELEEENAMLKGAKTEGECKDESF